MMHHGLLTTIILILFYVAIKDDTISLNSVSNSPVSGSSTSLNMIDRQRNNSLTGSLNLSNNRPIRPAPAIPRALDRTSNGINNKRQAPTVPPRFVLIFLFFYFILLFTQYNIIILYFLIKMTNSVLYK